MNPMRLFLFLIAFSVSSLRAQGPADSLLVIQTQWQEKTVKPGVVWKQAHYTQLYNSQQEINLIEVDLTQKNVRLAFEGFPDSLALSSAIAQKEQAIAAINGAFFDTKKGGGVTLLRKDKRLINTTRLLDKTGRRTERANGALVLKGKKTHILKGDNTDIDWDKKIKARDVLVCGPLLLANRKIITLERNAFNNNRHPRSVVAITSDKKLICLTVDGRNAQAQGMSLPELAYFLYCYGAKEALNLDGGGSTTLYIANQGTNGVVNYPSDNKRFDHEGERKVANALLIFER